MICISAILHSNGKAVMVLSSSAFLHLIYLDFFQDNFLLIGEREGGFIVEPKLCIFCLALQCGRCVKHKIGCSELQTQIDRSLSSVCILKIFFPLCEVAKQHHILCT